MLEPEFLELMGQTIQWEAAGTIDGYGKRGYKGAAPIKCHIRHESVEITGPDGTVATAAGQAWLAGHFPDVTTSDRITLPNEGGTRGVAAVNTVYDELGPHHTVIAYGTS